MIDHDRLWAFATFAEDLNFTHAAARLHITQPALHVKVAKLAEELGVPLYRRIGRKLELTAEGKRVAAFARDVEDRSAAFLGELRGMPARAPVVLAAGAGAYLYLLGAGIRAYLRRRTHAPLRLLTLDGPAAIDRVLSGEANLGVAVFETPPDDLDSSLLAVVDPQLVVPRGHRLAKRRSIELGDLEGESLIVPPAGRPHRRTIDVALRAAGTSWNVAVEAMGWELMLHFVSLGLGIAIVNACCRIPTGLVAKRIEEMRPTYYYLFHRPGTVRSEAAALKDAILTRPVWRGGRTRQLN